ncbi:MAG: hypothetical protein ACE5PT_04360 [Gemmatimonadales bacterium]
MLDELDSAEDHLITEMAEAARGPKRNGLFALWLFVRLCRDRFPPVAVSDRAHRRRLDNVERRLSSLSLPAAIRRAITASIRDLKQSGSVSVPLRQLIAPAREALGSGAADAVALAARTAGETAQTQVA